jgi:hypothetical protein
MNPTEAAQLLAHAAAFDNRKPSAAASKAWAAALHDVPLDEDALTAVARYYGVDDPQATGQRWIQPHHVRAHRKAIRRERIDAAPIPAPAGVVGEAGYRQALRGIIRRIGDGKMPFRAIEAGGGVEPTEEYLAKRAELDRRSP